MLFAPDYRPGIPGKPGGQHLTGRNEMKKLKAITVSGDVWGRMVPIIDKLNVTIVGLTDLLITDALDRIGPNVQEWYKEKAFHRAKDLIERSTKNK